MLQDNRRDNRRQFLICQLDCIYHNYQRNPEEGESQSGQVFMERTELEMGLKGQGRGEGEGRDRDLLAKGQCKKAKQKSPELLVRG